jgi:segregation and condensation protein B
MEDQQQTPPPEQTAEAPAEAVPVEQLGLMEKGGKANTDEASLRGLIEAAVYITDEPLSAQQIAQAIGRPVEVIQPLLDQLVEEYARPHHGLSVRELAGGYKMATKPEHHEELRQFVKKLKPPLKLSLPALETLAVVAYKQPITAPEIMEIRGVQGAGVLKTLLDRKLIQAAGRKAVIGRPVLYRTTREFLIQFGLKDISELPTLKEFEELGRMALGEGVEEEVERPPAAPEAAGEESGGAGSAEREQAEPAAETGQE